MKKGLRTILRLCAARHGVSVIVASMGRSGSTLLTHAVALAAMGTVVHRLSRQPGRMIIRYEWVLSALSPKRGLVYKTHDRPVAGLPDHCRTIYTFSDPFDVIASLNRQRHTKGEEWMQSHAANMVGHDVCVDRMYGEDIYELEPNFDSWMRSPAPNTLLVRYDRLWHYQEKISSFLGFRIELPPYRPRRSSIERFSPSIQARVRSTYGRLREKVLATEISVR